jgi:hypothetical protein
VSRGTSWFRSKANETNLVTVRTIQGTPPKSKIPFWGFLRMGRLRNR